jgi:hypothetical protein
MPHSQHDAKCITSQAQKSGHREQRPDQGVPQMKMGIGIFFVFLILVAAVMWLAMPSKSDLEAMRQQEVAHRQEIARQEEISQKQAEAAAQKQAEQDAAIAEFEKGSAKSAIKYAHETIRPDIGKRGQENGLLKQ